MSRLVKNSILYLTSTIVLKATSFFLLPLYSTLIPPEAYGKVYLISSYITFFGLFMSFSMHGAIQRFFFDCKDDDDVKELYSTVVIFIFGVATFLAFCLFALNNVIAGWMDLPDNYLFIATITVYFSTFYNLIIALLYAKQQAVIISLTSIICGLLTILAQLTLVLIMKDKAFAMVLSMLITGVINLLLFLWFSRKYFIIRFNLKKLKLAIVYGLSQFPSDISTFVVSLSDRFILNKYKDSRAVGIYGMGNTLGSIPQIIFASMNSALAPIVFTDYTNQKEGRVYDISYSCILIEKIAIMLTALITLLIAFSNNIVALLSDKYQQSELVMFLVLIAVLIDIYRKLFMFPITYEIKFVKVKSTIWIFASILSISLNLMLIPKFSYVGACISLISTNILTLIVILIASHKAMNPVYKVGKLLLIFIVSMSCSTTFFLGSSSYMLIAKIIVTCFYLYIVYRIYPINYWALLTFLNLKKRK